MTATRSTVGERLAWIDRLRGIAVVLMVLDHTLVLIDGHHWLRYTATRLALPLFVGCAAIVFRGTISSRRVWQLAAAICVEAIVGPQLAIAVPGPVALIAATALVMTIPAVRARAGVVGALGLVQALYLPVPWHGYQPGLVVAWWVLGAQLVEGAARCGSEAPAVLGWIGRRPLGWYCGHLVGLLVLHRAGVL